MNGPQVNWTPLVEGAPKKLFGASRPPPKEEFADKIPGFSEPPVGGVPNAWFWGVPDPPWRERFPMARFWVSGPPLAGGPRKKISALRAPPW